MPAGMLVRRSTRTPEGNGRGERDEEDGERGAASQGSRVRG